MQSSQQINRSEFGVPSSEFQNELKTQNTEHRTQYSERITSDERCASGRQRIIAAIICIGLSIFFVSFAVAAHYHVDMGSHLGRCGFKQMYGLPCPTCGYTTATIAFAQGKILKAFYIQPACALICSVFVLIDIISFIIAVFGINLRFISRFFTEVKIRHIIFALIIIVTSGWAVTLARAVAQR